MRYRPTSSSRNYARRGLTLMELVVVMTVLAALAAILIPLFPNLLRRAHKVSDTTQTSEMAKSVQMYQALYLAYPNEWDSMVATGGTQPDFLPIDGGNAFGAAATITPLTADEAAALGRVGITSVHDFLATAPRHPTMDPYAVVNTVGTPAVPTTLAAGTNVYMITAANVSSGAGVPVEIQNIVIKDPTARFAVFGVGPRTTMVGTVVQNAPTSVPQNAGFTPANTYSRVGVIFQVSGTALNTTERARFVASAALEDDEIESTEKDLVGYYQVAASGN